MSEDDEQEREWQAIYEGLQRVLSRHGHEDPYGKADYWIIDDNWGCYGHKIEVHAARFLTRAVAKEVQGLLQDPFLRNPWYVIIAFAPADSRYTGSDEGIKVTADRIEEQWNRTRLQAELKGDFRWNEQ